MKYMMTFSIAPSDIMEVRKRFAEPEPLEGIKMLGRWHVLGNNNGFVLIETDNPVALTKYVVHWADLSDTSVVPVIEDEEMRKALGG